MSVAGASWRGPVAAPAPRRSRAAWSPLRATLRLGCALPIVLAAPALGALALGWPTRSPARRAARIERTVSGIARALLRSLGVRVEASGALPTGGALVAANHLGWLDVLACAATWPSLRFVAKREVAAWPLVGAVVRARGTVLVDRTRKRDLLRVIPALGHGLAAGEAVCLFAEGTTSDGRAVLPFRSSLFEAAVRTTAPVVPLAIDALVPTDGPPAATHVCWWGDMSLLAHLPRVAGLRRCVMRLRLGAPLSPPVAHHDGTCLAHATRSPRARQRLAADARAAVVALRGGC